jgi:hypothetical protein
MTSDFFISRNFLRNALLYLKVNMKHKKISLPSYCTEIEVAILSNASCYQCKIHLNNNLAIKTYSIQYA